MPSITAPANARRLPEEPRPVPRIIVAGRPRAGLTARLQTLRAARDAGGRLDADELAILDRLSRTRA